MSSWAIARCGVPAARALRTLSGTEPLDLATLDRLADTGSRRFLERLLIASDAVPPRDSRLAWLEAWTEQLLSATEPEEHRRALRGYARWVVLRRVRDRPGYQPLTKNRPMGRSSSSRSPTTSLATWRPTPWISPTATRPTSTAGWTPGRRRRTTCDHSWPGWPSSTWPAGSTCRRIVPRCRDRSRPTAPLPTGSSTRRTWRCPTGWPPRWWCCSLNLSSASPACESPTSSSPTTRSGSASPPAPSSCRARVAAGIPDQGWLFPGGAPGQPINEGVLSKRLQRIGVQPGINRHGALVQLCGQLPAAVVSDLLGVSVQTAERWANIAGRPWADYIAARLDGQDTH